MIRPVGQVLGERRVFFSYLIILVSSGNVNLRLVFTLILVFVPHLFPL